MKRLVSVAASIAMIAASVTPAFGAWVTMRNTGPYSKQIMTFNKNFWANVTNNQTGNVTNNVVEDSNTGGNAITGNTNVTGNNGGTGNATTNIIVDNQVNGLLTAVEGCPCEDNTNVTAENTGPYSANNVTVNANSNITVTNKQDGKVVNNITVTSNTGNNPITGNTYVSGFGGTGWTNTFLGVANWINRSETYINVPTPTP